MNCFTVLGIEPTTEKKNDNAGVCGEVPGVPPGRTPGGIPEDPRCL